MWEDAHDGESRINSINSGTDTYFYGANGDRVRKNVGSSWTEYTYFGGQPIAEWNSNGTLTDYIYAAGQRIAMAPSSDQSNPSATTDYYTSDQIGSARMITNGSGGILSNYVFYPFGQGSQPDENHYLFSGKERDSESGLDNFGARYLTSTMGRFMSPDPLLNSGHPWDPQSWNRYAYTRNNPVKRIDPSGMYDVSGGCLSSNGSNNCQRLKDDIAKAKELLKTMAPKSHEAKELTKALKAIGTENDHNGVSVSFGKTKAGGSLETDGQHLTIDFKKVDAAEDNHRLGGESLDDRVDDASLVAHEGIHLANNKVREGQADEPEAYDLHGDYRWSSFNHYATGLRGVVEIESE